MDQSYLSQGFLPPSNAEYPGDVLAAMGSGPAPRPAPAEMPIRVLAFLAGGVALLLASVLSFGLGFVALLGMGVAALVRWRRLTRLGSLIGAVLFVTLTFGGIMGWAVTQQDGGLAGFEREIEAADRQPPPPSLTRLEKYLPAQNRQLQEQSERIVRSRPMMLWSVGMGMLIACVLFGVFIGTAAWGCMMLIGFGIRGRWPLARSPA